MPAGPGLEPPASIKSNSGPGMIFVQTGSFAIFGGGTVLNRTGLRREW
jgi:hypothetical protein